MENVYTQHTPALVGLLERLARSQLSDVDYPRVDRASSPQPQRVRGAGAPAGAGQGQLTAELPPDTAGCMQNN